MSVPRSEYPRPQMVRKDWLCLNGPWQFEIDSGDSGLERGLLDRPLTGTITVPFCPESTLSGVGCTDFMNAVWYRREVTIPPAWSGRDVLLHFQAMDYDATVWVNGREVGHHRGGFTPFTCPLAGVVEPGQTATIVVRARDDHRQVAPRGKQAEQYANYGCLYTRTTGIWQTVWLEPVPQTHMKRPKITPDVSNGAILLDVPVAGPREGVSLRARLTDSAGEVCSAQTPATQDFTPHLELRVPEPKRHLWSPEDPHLYGLTLELVKPGGETIDRIESYAGLRSVAIDGQAIRINGKSVFQRLVLDQGFYPDGILTAPTDEALVRDIEISMAAGFNGARLHQKVFEERFLFHADRLGYLCWGEFPDWALIREGPRRHHPDASATYITQWLEALERDYSHPCIVGWCGLNETRRPLTDRIDPLDDVMRGMFLAAKAMDPTRPVLDVSGYSHHLGESDVCDCHNYEQDVAKFQAEMGQIATGQPWTNYVKGERESVPYRGQPFFNSEFGGTWWNADAKPGMESWGYGDCPKTVEEFCERFEALCRVQLENPHLFGYCYTQLTDVFQEQNGIFTFDRRPKFDLTRIAAAQRKKAAIEG